MSFGTRLIVSSLFIIIFIVVFALLQITYRFPDPLPVIACMVATGIIAVFLCGSSR